MKDYRIVFEKRGRVKYISHLDLNRCMLRAVRRSGLPAWYTEGFHPHMYLMFPLALSLGAESICEVMDLRLTEEVQPEELLARPKHVTQDVGSAEYEVTLTGDRLSERWEAFFAQEQILTEKKTKKGMKEIDIKPLVTVESVTAEGDALHLTMRLPAGNEGNLNVSVVTDAFAAFAETPVFVREVLRTKIFCLDGGLFF